MVLECGTVFELGLFEQCVCLVTQMFQVGDARSVPSTLRPSIHCIGLKKLMMRLRRGFLFGVAALVINKQPN